MSDGCADMGEVVLDGATLSPAALVEIAHRRARVTLARPAMERIRAGRAIVDDIVARAVPVYGVTTGLGSQKDFALAEDMLAAFNRRVIVGHATFAPGAPAPEAVVRAAMAIQLNLYATGRSGVRLELVEVLLARLNASAVPPVRIGSSVGASDIVALSQLALPLVDGVAPEPCLPGGLAPKEALSLMNSNALTLAQSALALEEAGQLIAALDLAAALSLEGLRGNPDSWSEVVDRAHPQPGQAAAGRHLRRLLAGSRLLEHGQPRFLQDPLSFRCVPQIHGAARAALAWARGIVLTELNAAVDNPAIDLETSAIISHGNMDTTLLALALDTVRLGLAKVLQASGERTHKLQWPSFSGLPTGLAETPGAIGGVQFLNLAHIAAAKIATASIAAGPTGIHYHGQLCDGVEDVGGLAPHAADATEKLLEAAWTVAAVEMTVACWAVLRRNIPTQEIGAGLQEIFAEVTKLLPRGREGERPFDLGSIEDVIRAQVRRGPDSLDDM